MTPFLFSTDLFLSHTHRRAGVPSSSWWRELSRALLKPCCRGHVDTLKLFSAACEVVKELCNTGDWRCEFHASCSSEPPSFCFCLFLSLFFHSIYHCVLSVAVDVPSHFCHGQPDAGFARLCVLMRNSEAHLATGGIFTCAQY